MQLNDLWQFIQDGVFSEPSTPVFFNPYHDATLGFDKTDAASIRRENLRNYHCHFVRRPTVLLVGKVTGAQRLPLLRSAVHQRVSTRSNALPFIGRQSSSRAEPLQRAVGIDVLERDAGFRNPRRSSGTAFRSTRTTKEPQLSIRAPSPAEIR